MQTDKDDTQRMESHQRRQAILQLLEKKGEVAIEELADQFVVSTNTIRNDLNALGQDNLLRRVRGGAASSGSKHGIISKRFASRFSTNQKAKDQMGRWAASLVKDGDAVVLDASSTIYHMATYLQNHKKLTVVTNGIEVALLLAQNPSIKVILAANSVRPDGLAVMGSLQPDLLNHFFASKCFITSSGLSLEQDLTEEDSDEARMKSQMIGLARQVIALVDHSKFGKLGTYRFAELNQIDHLIMDDGIDPDFLANLSQVAKFSITVTREKSAQTIEPNRVAVVKDKYRIGFGNLTEDMLFAHQVRKSIEQAAKKHTNIELLIRNNNLDRQKGLENADWFIENQVDLVIEYQLDAEAGYVIMDKFNRAGIPVIAIDIPMPGAVFYGAENYRAGYIAGEALGQWIKKNWGGKLDILLKLESTRAGHAVGARLQGQQEGLEAIIGPLTSEQIISIDSPVVAEIAESSISNLLPELSTDARIPIISINDDAALGALAAFENAGRLGQVVAVGQNADRLGRAALRRSNFPFIGSTRYAPEQYGEQIIDLALKILSGEGVPPAIYNQHVFITAENLDDYYPEEKNSRPTYEILDTGGGKGKKVNEKR